MEMTPANDFNAEPRAAFAPDFSPAAEKRNGEAITKKLPRGRPFAKGASGNPHGRPAGSRNKATVIAEAMFEEYAGKIIARLVAEAVSGNMRAIGICMDRIWPRSREAAIEVELPEIETAGDCGKALSALIAATASAEVTPGDALKIAKLIEARVRYFAKTARNGDAMAEQLCTALAEEAGASAAANSNDLQQNTAKPAADVGPSAEQGMTPSNRAVKSGDLLQNTANPRPVAGAGPRKSELQDLQQNTAVPGAGTAWLGSASGLTWRKLPVFREARAEPRI